jgi:hypothetical protein
MEQLQTLLANELESLNSQDYKRRLESWPQGFSNPRPLPQLELKRLQQSSWRKLIVQWCYAVADTIEADREIVYITIDILDRYIAIKKAKNEHREIVACKKQYEAVVMSSLILSTRLYSSNCIPLSVKDLLDKTSSTITTADLTSTAVDIYKALTWQTCVPTAARFVHALIKLLPDTVKEAKRTELFQDAVFQIELSVYDEFIMNLRPSLVAWMVLENKLYNRKLMTVPEHMKFREDVASLTGHSHSIFIRHRLESLSEEREESSYVQVFDSGYVQPPRPSSASLARVVSNTSLTSKRSREEDVNEDQAQCSMHRIKRCKNLSAKSA